MKWILMLQAAILVAIVAGGIWLAPYVGAALEGAVDRFDHMIEYEETE